MQFLCQILSCQFAWRSWMTTRINQEAILQILISTLLAGDTSLQAALLMIMALSPGSSARDPASHMEPLVIKTRTVKPFSSKNFKINIIFSLHLFFMFTVTENCVSVPGNQSIPDSKVTILCWTQEF